jgi:glycerophosphoryl diester phosphodiesterase
MHRRQFSLLLASAGLSLRASAKTWKHRLIAHRGGVVDEHHSENSPGAIEAAIERGYYMVEADLRRSRDGKVVVHHDETFRRFYGDDRKLGEMTWEEISQLRATPGNTRPMLFDELCKLSRGRMQLMLDTKPPQHPESFLASIEQSMRENGLLENALVIGTGQSRQYFLGKAKVGATAERIRQMQSEGKDVAREMYVFEWGVTIQESDVGWAQENGVLVVPSINTFHYPRFGKDPIADAGKDIARLKKAGVEYYQIDSVYEQYFE